MRLGLSLIFRRLLLASVLSILSLAETAHAHEVVPTIADIEVSADRSVRMEFRINLEAFLAGVDLDSVTDTNDDPRAADYDTLRALPAEELATRAEALLDRWNEDAVLRAGERPVALRSTGLVVPEDVDIELPRASQWSLVADLPEGADAVSVAWPEGHGALVLRQQGAEDAFTGYLEGGQVSPPIGLTGAGAQSGLQAFLGYIPVGFDHILPKGLDHILFVLGLFFLSPSWRPLLWQVSAFTLAHTVTLALGALGWVSVPSSIVEPLIAASITFVAVENIFSTGLSRWRPFVIFGFGLLHGLGFASVLGEFGLPQDQFLPALIGFNIGVELGQLTVIALAFLAVGWFARRDASQYRTLVSVPASCIIAAVGAWWAVERVFL